MAGSRREDIMKRHVITGLLVALAFIGLGRAASAATAGIRGRVIDKDGKPLPGVQVEMEFKGESRVKIVKTQQTDKQGGFVRIGIPDGNWKITFTKEGFKPYVMEIYLSLMPLGSFSTIEDVVLQAGASAAAPAPESAPAEAILPAGDESEKAGEQYAAAVEAAKAGRFEEAEAGLRGLLEKYPNLAGAHFNLGYVYRMKKDYKAAEAEFQKVTEIEPAKPDAFIALAGVRELDGRSSEAADGLISAVGSFEQDARFQYVLGLTCINAGKTPEAEAAFQKVATLDPANPEPSYHLATIAVGQGKAAEAVALLEKYLGMTGQDPNNLATAKGLLAALQKKKSS
jgi:Flp pilus assembly protein TadD